MEAVQGIGRKDVGMARSYTQMVVEGGMDLRNELTRERESTLAHYFQGIQGGKIMEGAKDFITMRRGFA